MVKRNVIATKLTKICTQTQKRAFDVAVNGEEEGIDDKDDKNAVDEEEEDLFSTTPAHESRQLRSLSRHTRENGSATFKTFNIINIVVIIILSSSSIVITIIIIVIIVFKINKNLTLMIVTIMTQSRQMDTKVCLLLRKLPRNEMKACSGIKECPSV